MSDTPRTKAEWDRIKDWPDHAKASRMFYHAARLELESDAIEAHLLSVLMAAMENLPFDHPTINRIAIEYNQPKQ